MTTPVVDLRSDTVTRPCPAMRRAMASAEVGDDVYGEDPSVNALEAKVAERLGFEAALFTPTGTMANQIAIALHTRPGESVIAEADSHCFVFEAGAAAALSGVQFDLVPRELDFGDDAIDERLRADGLHDATTSLLVVENTHNRGGGSSRGPEALARIQAAGRRHGLRLHCDGARLWNAAVVRGVEERELAAGFDTVAVCFSKGLGAPLGSALVGDRESIDRARKLRKRFGGGMRQAGIAAAAAIHALDHHREALVEDHRRAAELARALRESSDVAAVTIPEPATNMVYWRLREDIDGDAWVAHMRERGVLLHHLGRRWIRAVTHRDLGDLAVAEVASILAGDDFA